MKYNYNSIQLYIFNWKKVNNNSIKIYNEAIKYINHVTIINSDENLKLDNSINHIQLNDKYFYGGQFKTAISNVKSDKILVLEIQ